MGYAEFICMKVLFESSEFTFFIFQVCAPLRKKIPLLHRSEPLLLFLAPQKTKHI